uniref:Putative ovule protein n=1 Tax=Solanum chacoense TaxID=4108 RepID=A0A0V0HFM5_SOLCH
MSNQTNLGITTIPTSQFRFLLNLRFQCIPLYCTLKICCTINYLYVFFLVPVISKTNSTSILNPLF